MFRTLLHTLAFSFLSFVAASSAMASAPRSPISVTLKLTALDPASRAGEIAAEVVSLEEAPDTRVELLLPPGATADRAEWTLDLKAGEPVELTAAFTLGAAPGNTEIRLLAQKEWGPRNRWGDMGSIPLHLATLPGTKLAGAAREGWVVDRIPVASLEKEGDAPILSMEPTPFAFPDLSLAPVPSVNHAATQPQRPWELAPAPPEQINTVTLTGRWRYHDRSAVPQAADQQMIEVTRSDGSRIGSGVFGFTDTDGTFSIAFAHPGTDLRVQLVSRTVFNSPTGDVLLGVYEGVNIPGGCGSDDLDCAYFAQTGVIQCADGNTCNVGNWLLTAAQGEPWLGATQMTQDLIRSYKKILFDNRHGGSPHSGSARISFPANTGPVFQRGGTNDNWISIPTPSQTASDVVLHEYGHAVMYTTWAGLSPRWPTDDCPSPHVIQNNSAPGCALSEGFADFWPLYSNQFYDGDNSTANDGPTYDSTGFTVDFENFAPANTGDMVEGNFAATLWDMFDATNEGSNNISGTDPMTDGIGHIWHSLTGGNSANDVSGWWADYKAVADHDKGPVLSALWLNTIDYGYVPNDICHNADIVHVNYNDWAQTAQATTDLIEPQVFCANGSRSSSVWYRSHTTTPGWYHVTTFGSTYDTIVQAYTGSCGSLTPIAGACNDDAAGGTQSELVIQNPGVPVYFMVTAYTAPGSGLNFSAELWSCLNDFHCDARTFCRTARCDLANHQCSSLPPPCNDGDPCTTDACIDSRALCVNTPEPTLDPDGDGVCATLDGCPDAFDPGQADFDADGQGDACDADDDNDLVADGDDCASLDPAAWGIPGDVPDLSAARPLVTLLWDSLAPALGPGARYDVLRGDLAVFPVGATPAETCLASTGLTQLEDGADPPPGTGLWYLVRPRNACGTGSYGFASDGTERRSVTCP